MMAASHTFRLLLKIRGGGGRNQFIVKDHWIDLAALGGESRDYSLRM